MIPRRVLIWITVAVVITVTAGSFLPFEAKRAIGTSRIGHARTSQFAPVTSAHRIYHFVSFGLIAFCALLLARKRRQQAANALRVMGLGVAIELTQGRIGRTQIEWWDIRDDAIGIVLAFALLQWPGLKAKLAGK